MERSCTRSKTRVPGSRSTRRSKSPRNGSKPSCASCGNARAAAYRDARTDTSSARASRPAPAAPAAGDRRAAPARRALHVRIVDLAQLQLAGEVRLQLVQHLQLVLERQLDVDALDRVGVVAHAIERNHDVFVDLERVRVTRNRRGARAIQPELLARVGVDGDEAFAGAAVGDAHDFGRRARDCVFVVADDVAEQHHLRQRAALGLRRVADGAQVALVEMLETGELHAARRAHRRRG